MKRRTFLKKTGAAGIIYFFSSPDWDAKITTDASALLEKNFLSPPASALPQTLWMWMNGNITKEGITLDLEAMKEVGIGGVLNFDAGTGIPKGPVEYLSEEWLALKKHAMQEADRLVMEFIMHNCPGWSSSGGPWITPEKAMQNLTWSETFVAGGKKLQLSLPKPAHRLNHYHDIAVLAFPSLEGEELLQTVQLASSSEKEIDRNRMTGSNPEGVIAEAVNGEAWLQFQFTEPYEAKLLSFFIAIPSAGGEASIPLEFGQSTSIQLQASEDGLQFRDVVRINTGLDTELRTTDKFIVFDIPVTKARFFRFLSTGTRRYKQVQFSGITRLKNWMEKTNSRSRNFLIVEEASTIETTNEQPVPEGSVIRLNSVLDLTDATTEGWLTWEAPPGNWTLIRLGFTPTGATNKAAPETGIGLECDKFDADAITFHFNQMTAHLLPVMKELAAHNRMGLEIDSYEAGSQNWTPGFEKLFERSRHYPIASYLPILAGGRIINSVDFTERFLWDFRRVQADLIAENYYGRFSELCRRNGIKAYFEPYEAGPFEEMQIGAKADTNLSEFWGGISTTTPAKTPVIRTPKLVSSIAHSNGQKIAGAEAFTSEPDASRWQEYPFALKALGDKIFTKGINRMLIHRYAHQPHPTALPGMTMGPWGMHFDRTVTWWKQGKAWLMYLARCQYLLQQGAFVSDLAYFTGEDANMYTRAHADDLFPVPPVGYDYDVINADAILQGATIRNNMLVLGNGMSYSVFVLQNYKALTLAFLQKLKELVQQGLVMVGSRPDRSLGLVQHDQEDRFKKLVAEIWGGGTENRLGKGHVYSATDLPAILQKRGIPPDFGYTSASGDAPLLYIHRRTGNTDIYFLCNQRRSYEEAVVTLRVKNKIPERWDPATGKTSPLPFYEKTANGIRLPVQLEPYGSLFIVLRKQAPVRHFIRMTKDGQTVFSTEDFSSQPFKPDTEPTQNFTLSFWAKPEFVILLQPQFTLGTIVQPWTDYYAVYPPAGEAIFGAGHATCGLTVGRNGVAVWEHATGSPALVLRAPKPVSGWAHIAVRYTDGLPTVYINGEETAKGKKSNFIVHPAIGLAALEKDVSWYNGDMSRPVLHHQALPADQIKRLAAGKPPWEKRSFVAELTANSKATLLFHQNGRYRLQNNRGGALAFDIKNIAQPTELKGPWQVRFPEGTGAPAQIILQQLASLHMQEDTGVKYFSGTAVYSIEFLIAQKPTGNKRLLLDLGSVEVIAEVKVNGRNCGILWKRPYRVDITDAAVQGKNRLEIPVTNLWPNRLIGDEQVDAPYTYTPGGGETGRNGLIGGYIESLPDWYNKNQPKPPDGRIGFATWQHFKKEDPLLPSGLIGPVALLEAVEKVL